LNDPFELPSLEEIEEMDRQRSQAIESLQLSISESDSGDFVKCQKCGIAVPMLRILTKPKSNRIAVLEKQIKWIEEHLSNR
jgi:RNA polymerase-binding transcription factor DksA